MANVSGVRVRFHNRNDSEAHSKSDSETELIVSFGDNVNVSDIEEAYEADDADFLCNKVQTNNNSVNLTSQKNDVSKLRHSLNSFCPDSVHLSNAIATKTTQPLTAMNTEKRQNDKLNKLEEVLHSKVLDTQDLADKSGYFNLSKNVVIFHRNILSRKFRFLWISIPICMFCCLPGLLCGLFLGIYFSGIMFFYACVSDPILQSTVNNQINNRLVKEIAEAKKQDIESKRIYKGWMNILNEQYNPHYFHVNTLQTVLVRLDGKLLRISKPDRSLLKHAFHTDPTLTELEPRMLSQNIYDLTDATVRLRPRRLAKRRWFSRKYPICIRLSTASQKQSLSQRCPERKNYRKHFVSKSNTYSINNVPLSSSATYNGLTSSNSLHIEKNDLPHSSSNEEVAQEADLFVSETSCSSNESDLNDSFICRSASDYSVSANGLRSMHQQSQSSFNNRKRLSSFVKSKSSRSIFLFARSAREKERWFHRLRKACSKYTLESSFDSNLRDWTRATSVSANIEFTRRRFSSLPNFGSALRNEASTNYLLYILNNIQFSKHLEDILTDSAFRSSTVESVGGIVSMDLGNNKWNKLKNEPSNNNSDKKSNTGFIVIVNLLASRIFYDFCRDEYWCKAVQKRFRPN